MVEMIIKMSAAALGMCLISAGMEYISKKTAFGKLKPAVQHVIIGIVFGMAAVCSTEYGVDYKKMVLNVRDIAPLSAGLFFSPVSGIIAGIIGGFHRYAVGEFLGIGAYTRVACAVSTFLAGIIGALFRKYLFEGKKPSAFYSLALGANMEVFHMLAVLMSHMDDISKAFDVVKKCTVPMIVFTGAGLMLTSFVISFSGERQSLGFHRKRNSDTPITKKFQVCLLVFVVSMFILTFGFTSAVQTKLTISSANELILLNAQDITHEFEEHEANLSHARELFRQAGMLGTKSAAKDIESKGGISSLSDRLLRDLADEYDIYEINYIDKNGIIRYSTNPEYIGFDMSSGEQSEEFMKLFDDNADEAVQDYQPTTYDSSISLMYIGIRIDDGFIQTGFNDSNMNKFESLADISSVTAERHIGETGFVIIYDKDRKIISEYEQYNGKSLDEIGVNPANNNFFFSDIGGTEFYCYGFGIGDYGAVITMSRQELYHNRDIFASETILMEILLFSVIFDLIYFLVKKIIINNLEKVNQSLARITGGDLNEVVNVCSAAEFSSLSHGINTTVDTLKKYISEAENRINAELEFAKAIQHAALPSTFPAYPDREEFDIYACMYTAKEVGGDFYDFFLVDEDHLALLIADVSGKGIPAAMFMMKSKTLINSLVESGLSPKEAFEEANRTLCDSNDAEMFVTAWLGILEIHTGIMKCVNAGHEYPAVKRKDGSYELFHDKHGFVLGGMETAKYREYELKLLPGDKLYLYTDGVTEATDFNNELYGTDRMTDALNDGADCSMKQTLENIKKNIDEFVDGASQFDDITMLGFEFKKLPAAWEKLAVKPDKSNTPVVTEFAESYFSKCSVPQKVIMKLNIAIDEIFSNIIMYSSAGNFEIMCIADDRTASICFVDDGIAYNPLEKSDPDITLSAEQREIGGLGIFMVKKTMSFVKYENTDGKNRLTIGIKY